MLTFQTTTSMFIDKKNLLKYNGFISVLQNTPLLLGPILGGVLLSLITMKEIILIDIVSFFVGFCFTTVISFPNMKYAKRKSLKWNQIVFSTQYIFKNKSLKNILLLFTIENFLGGLTLGLVTAFLLAKTNGDNLITAYTFSLVAVGGIIGGFIAYRVPKLMIHPFRNILIIFFLSGLVGRVFVGFFNSVLILGVCLMFRNIMIPLANAVCETVWQKNTPTEYQGRIFGTRRFFAQGGLPISILMGAWTVDFIFSKEAWWTLSIAKYFNITVESAQLSLLFIVCGCLEIITSVYYLIRQNK